MTDPKPDRPVMMTAFEHDVAAFASLLTVAAFFAWALFGG